MATQNQRQLHYSNSLLEKKERFECEGEESTYRKLHQKFSGKTRWCFFIIIFFLFPPIFQGCLSLSSAAGLRYFISGKKIKKNKENKVQYSPMSTHSD